MNLADYNTTAVNNTSAVPDGAPENGTKVSDFNDIIRELMARISRFARDNNGTLLTGGASGVYTLNINGVHAGYDGMTLMFRVNHANPGSATLNVNGMGARELRNASNQAMSGGELQTARVYMALFNGAQFQVQGVSQHGDLGGGSLHAVATTSNNGFLSSTDKAKLNGVASGAQVNPTAAAIKTLYEGNSNTNAFTDALRNKLNSLDNGGTGTMSATQILAALLTVDTNAAGLNASTLQGNTPNAFVFALNGLADVAPLAQNDDFLVYRPGAGHRRVGIENFNPPVVTLTGSRSLAAADANSILEYPTGGAITVTVPDIFSEGTQVILANHGSGTITVANSGIDLQSANGLRQVQPKGMAVIVRLKSNRFSLIGNLQ